MTACGSSREVARSSDRVATYSTERAEKEKDSVVVAEHDTIMEVTTIHVRTNEAGDTVFRSVVTDRLRGRSRDEIATQRTKQEVRVDTVYIEKRDSIEIRSRPSVGGGQSGGTALNKTLRLVLWIIVAVIILIIVVRLRK